MSATYPERTETNFPEAVDNLSRMSDLTFDDLPLVKQYEDYYNAGNLEAANALLESNPNLKTKIFNAAKFNKLADGIGAIQEYFINELQNYLNEQLTYAEEYEPDKRYKKTNIITFNGEGFICRVNESIGVAPVNGSTTANWALISKQGIQGIPGIGLSPRGKWDKDTQYYKDDCVVDNNILWQSLNDNMDSQPDINNSNWLKFLDIGNKADKKAPTSAGNLAILDEVGNLGDSTKQVSDFVLVQSKNKANGVAGLDNNGRIFNSQLPMVTGITTGSSDVLELAATNFTLTDGAIIRFRLHTNMNAGASLNVNATGAKNIVDITGKEQKAVANSYCTVIYSEVAGNFILQGSVGGTTTKFNNDALVGFIGWGAILGRKV